MRLHRWSILACTSTTIPRTSQVRRTGSTSQGRRRASPPLAAPQFLRRRARPLDRNQRKEISRSGRASLRQRVRLSGQHGWQARGHRSNCRWFRGRGIIGIGGGGRGNISIRTWPSSSHSKRRRNALAREMKITLCLLVFNERAGCEVDVPKLRRDTFDDVYAVDGGSTDGTGGVP